MRILTVLESPSWVDHHINGSLREMGHEVSCFSYGTFVGEYYGRSRFDERKRKNAALLELAKSLNSGSGLDLIFCYVYDDFLLPDHARKLAALGVPMVNYNVDMVNQWYRQILTAKYFTRILCAQRINMQHMQKYGASVLFFPMAARLPEPNIPELDGWQPAAPVTFVGTPMPYRKQVLGWLHQNRIPLAVYGKFWLEHQQALPDQNMEKAFDDILHYAWPRLTTEGPGVLLEALGRRWSYFAGNNHSDEQADVLLPDSLLHGFVPEQAMGALFRNSPINLGFSRIVGSNPSRPGINQLKLRDFEVPMAGGFYLVEQAPDYDQLFVPGVEVEMWRTPAELRDKIRYYLDHPSQCAMIAQAGAKRARAEHSWQHRFAVLFAELGLKN